MGAKTIAVLMLAIVLFSCDSRLITNLDDIRGNEGGSSDGDRYLFEVGSRLGEALARNYTIFVGRVSSVSSSSTLNRGQEKVLSNNAEVYVIVSEWLWNKPRNGISALRLRNFPSNTGNPWERPASPDGGQIIPRVGEQLLVISYPDRDSQPGSNGITNYAMVSNDEHIFEQVKRIVTRHGHYLKDPSLMARGLEKTDTNDDLMSCGYLVRYLWRAARPQNIDNDAIVLGKLLINNRIPSSAWSMVRMTLKRMLLDTDFPLSPATRSVVIDNLVGASAGNNIQLAQQTIPVLLCLSESRQLDIRPLLYGNHLLGLTGNYRTLVSTGYIQGEHPFFESQLGW